MLGQFPHIFLFLDEAECEKREQLRQKEAEIARCWIKYCLNLLQDAKKLLQVLHLILFFKQWVFYS